MAPRDDFEAALQWHQQGQWSQARAAYERCLKTQPRHAFARINLGSVCRQLGDLPAARTHLLRAVKDFPRHASAHYNLGNLYRALGDLHAAVQAYLDAIDCSQEPAQTAQAAYNLGLTRSDLQQHAQAEAAYRQALDASPQHVDASLNLATLLSGQGRLSEAAPLFESLLERVPEDARAINNLATIYQDSGRIEEALRMLRRAVALEPGLAQPRSNLLMGLQYDPAATEQDLVGQARDWGQWASARAVQLLQGEPARVFRPLEEGQPLRVGFVSADLSMHPVGLFLQRVMAAHDASRITPVLYSNGSLRDGVTVELSEAARQKGGGLREVKDLDDLALARQIRADGIDVLVDLSGHTGKSRLAMFALRPAPVQMSWLGYFATTGLPAIDFVILDPHHAPEGTEQQFTERLVRMPHNRFCYSPVPFAPGVSPAPCAHRGFITFGSFNNSAKLNEQVLSAWAQILRSVQGSRLVLKWRTFSDAPHAGRVRRFFADKGIDPERIELRGMSVHRELLEQYADIDIALDPFPFSGGHTSCEALWMGVPVITWPQARVVARQTLSFLANIGLTELAASSLNDYVRLAVELAGQPQRLNALREGLRARMQASPLCDVPPFARTLEHLYRELWETVRKETAQAWAVEGVRQRQTGGSAQDRIACYRKACELAPQEGMYAANLSSALAEAGEHAEAEQYALKARALMPERFEPLFNLGLALSGLRRHPEAAEAFTDAAGKLAADAAGSIEADPRMVSAWQAAGDAWHHARMPLKAAQAYQQALRVLGPAPVPERAQLLGAFGEKLEAIYHFAEAEQAYREALAISPDDVSLITNLGNALRAQRRFDAARQCYEQVLALRPDLAGTYSNIGTVLQALGENEEAVQWHRKALERDPQLVPVWSNLAATMVYASGQTPQALREALKGYDEHVARPLLDTRAHAVVKDPNRRLRVGYVSADFRKHAVAYFALPLIEGHHRDQVEVFCYYNHLQHDEWTARFQNTADHWRHVASLDDEALAEQIRADGIDVLVDLTGHTEGNRLLVFARKPAPVQVTWMGYVTTTGMQAMDWRVTHADADPAGAEDQYSERLFRLPGTMWCYRPLPGMPEVSPPPHERKGHVTFGSFNRYAKNGREVLEAWARILVQVPDARLLLCIPEGSVRQELSQFMQERGVDPGRVDCFAKVGHDDFWKLHAEVDIALDPFPFGGGTTTCETLWLGVPLVTCTGTSGREEPGAFAARFASRMGYAFLHNLGHPELAAATVQGYVDTAVALARDPARMKALRAGLRAAMAAAPMTDEQRFAREMESAYRSMWQDWLARHPQE